jgi:hypothetical protein
MSADSPGPAAVAYDGGVVVGYAPASDGDPDPGEVVWTWVPFEDDPAQGKDRPLLVIGTPAQGAGYVALLLSSRDRRGEHGWVHLGSGSWDREGRDSWVNVERLLLVHDGAIRREGAVVDRDRFAAVVAKAVRERRGEQVD